MSINNDNFYRDYSFWAVLMTEPAVDVLMLGLTKRGMLVGPPTVPGQGPPVGPAVPGGLSCIAALTVRKPTTTDDNSLYEGVNEVIDVARKVLDERNILWHFLICVGPAGGSRGAVSAWSASNVPRSAASAASPAPESKSTKGAPS